MTIKYLKILFFACLTASTTYGQADDMQIEKMSTSTVYTFNYQKGASSIPYKVTAFEKKESPVKLENEDVKKTNYSRENTPNYVTKLMYVDHMVDNTMDQYIVLKYIEDDTDNFEVAPTEKGFMVKVDDKKAEYVFGEGIFFLNNEDKDFFIVDEFVSL